MIKNGKQLIFILMLFVWACTGVSLGQHQTGDTQTPAHFQSTDAQSKDSFSAFENKSSRTGQIQNGLAPISSAGNQPIEGDRKLDERSEPQKPYQLTGRYHLEEGSTSGYLVLQVELAEGAYIHSLTQAKEMNPSVINVKPSNQLQTKGSFQPDRNPTVIEKDPIFDCRMEKHTGKIQFFVPIELQPGTDLQTFNPAVTFSGQVCTNDGVCLPLRNETVPAKFSGFFLKTARKENTDQKQ